MVMTLREVLYSLLKVAIHGVLQPGVSYAGVDWHQLLLMSARQGVRGLVWQGVKRASELGAPVEMSAAQKMEWFASVRAIEAGNRKMFDLSAGFAHLILPQKCVVLKGIDYARFWPEMFHREFGDLDCWSGENQESVNLKAAENGMTVEPDDGKHNHIFYGKLMVENHRLLVSDESGRRGRETEQALERLLGNSFEPIAQTDMLSPNVNFTAVFMLRHLQQHFLYEGVRLKHVLDWLFFLRSEAENVDWPKVHEALEICRLRKMADMLTVFAGRYFAEPVTVGLAYTPGDRMLERFDDLLYEPDMNRDLDVYSSVKRFAGRMKKRFYFSDLLG